MNLDNQSKAALGGYTRDQLDAAFDQIKDPANWKYPIDTVVPADCGPRLIKTAVTWFAGCIANVEPVRDAEGILTGWHVQAAGYYASVDR